ncbi:hypothetical protein GVAV_001255 [Gurleya vavrai]
MSEGIILSSLKSCNNETIQLNLASNETAIVYNNLCKRNSTIFSDEELLNMKIKRYNHELMLFNCLFFLIDIFVLPCAIFCFYHIQKYYSYPILGLKIALILAFFIVALIVEAKNQIYITCFYVLCLLFVITMDVILYILANRVINI